MPKESRHFYEFEGICLYPDNAELRVIEDGRTYSIRPKERDLLMALIRKPTEVVTYEELRQNLWPEFAEVKDILPTIRETKRTISKLLKDIGKKPDNIIQTIVGEGYRLNVEVRELWEGERELTAKDATVVHQVSPERAEIDEGEPTILSDVSTAGEKILGRFDSVYAGHLWQILGITGLYGLLYAIALIQEVAYQFERFGATSMVLACVAFCWICITSLGGFFVNWKLARMRKHLGLPICLATFILAALVLYLSLGLFFPTTPITEASFQTYPAHAAFLKNVCYFLPLAILFLIIPYDFVISAQRELKEGDKQHVIDVLRRKDLGALPHGGIYLRLLWLGILLLIAAIAGAIGIAHLLDNLQPSIHLNLFVQLEQWRTFVFFAIGLESMLWYHRMINGLRIACGQQTK